LTLAYEGTDFAGWQRQKNARTVQGVLEAALAVITGRPVSVIGAGRTDAGVHARGQVAHFKTDSPRALAEIVRGGNALLPPAAAIVSAAEAPLDFHARYQAKSKTYDYDLYLGPVRPVIGRRYVWHAADTLDTAAMNRALSRLVGRRDFAAFQSTGSEVKTTVRTIFQAEMAAQSDCVRRISLTGDGFLRHMVRAVVGTLVLVGRGRMTPDEFEAVLASGDRSRAGPTAPAWGLCLREVVY
jgi:tRNA pseudouridine38-40 synthase